ncbi:MAG: efflux RND transporter periplasmic adaptor subunit [Gemmataceae bacterium]
MAFMCSRIMGGFVLGALFFGLLGCQRTKQREEPPKLVRVVKPVQKNVPKYVMYTGNTKGIQTVEVKARVTGYLTKIGFKDGDYVPKDGLLFIIDQRPFQAQFDAAEAQLKAAIADEVKTRSEYDRNASLYKKNAVSKADVDITLGNWEVAKANIDLAKANLQTADINLKFTTIRAPFNGIASRHYLDIGNVVNADTTKLTDFIQYDPMYAYWNISETDALYFLGERLKKGEKRELSKGAFPVELGLQNETGYPHKGWVDFVNNSLNTGTATLQIRGVFPNPPLNKGADKGKESDMLYDLLPGLFVRVRAQVGVYENALLIPDDAIGTDQRGNYVYVLVDKDGAKVVESRQVQLGPLEGGLRTIVPDPKAKEGNLKPDDLVVSEGLLRIRPGDKVVIQSNEPPPGGKQP